MPLRGLIGSFENDLFDNARIGPHPTKGANHVPDRVDATPLRIPQWLAGCLPRLGLDVAGRAIGWFRFGVSAD